MRKVVLIIALFSSVCTVAQNTGSITGKVIDHEMNDEPLLFASISLKNTLFSTQSNLHGNFEFVDLAPGIYTIVFHSLGYEPIEMPIRVEAGEATYLKKGLHALSTNTQGLFLSETSANTSIIGEVKVKGGK